MDMRGEQNIFAPFFGVQTATMTAPIRLLKAGKAVMIPMLPVREPGNRYRLEIFPPLPELSGDDVTDLSRMNAAIEMMVRKVPEQYWWIHRRFKTRPPGEPPFYSD
jgi:KDO2-lipid IV(A) lauroyltransferase